MIEAHIAPAANNRESLTRAEPCQRDTVNRPIYAKTFAMFC